MEAIELFQWSKTGEVDDEDTFYQDIADAIHYRPAGPGAESWRLFEHHYQRRDCGDPWEHVRTVMVAAC